MHNINILIPTTPGRRLLLARCIASIYTSEGLEPNKIMVSTFENDVGWVTAVRNMLSRFDDDELVFIVNDDCIFEKDALKILIDDWARSECHLAQPNDGVMHGAVATLPFGKAGYLKTHIYEGYKSYYADTELTDCARKEGKYLYVPGARIMHKHWSIGQAPRDETYASQEGNLDHDKALYQLRKNSI